MSISAKLRRITFVGFDGVQMLDMTGPADVFSIADFYEPGSYDIRFVGTSATATGANGLSFQLGKLPKIGSKDTVIVPGGGARSVYAALADKELMAWLRKSVCNAERVASVCSGSFILARLGLLDNKRAVTHWSAVDHLAKHAPNTTVTKDAIFVQDGNIWTSAGVTTGIDLALAIVREDLGREIALRIARDIVVPIIRPGNQSQYSAPLAMQKQAGPNLDKLIPWLESRLSETTTVSQMAEKMGMSERQFHRECLLRFGQTPAKFALELRLDHARNFLCDVSLSIAQVGSMSGFSDSASFSKAFKRLFGISPFEFRKCWIDSEQHS
ncbi:GlxA family transcriptional regulator [Pyruvatibacter mobilis]|uniref:GlxA family transcriptional regulator n=1 Tax=Pyruvatibacter mobilis TaxID=1712261 RepID=UPI003BA8BED2